MSDNQFVQNAKLKFAKQADKVTEKTTQTETQNPSPSRVGRYPTIQTGVTQKMGKMTKLELNQSMYHTHNPTLYRTCNPVLLMLMTQLL